DAALPVIIQLLETMTGFLGKAAGFWDNFQTGLKVIGENIGLLDEGATNNHLAQIHRLKAIEQNTKKDAGTVSKDFLDFWMKWDANHENSPIGGGQRKFYDMPPAFRRPGERIPGGG